MLEEQMGSQTLEILRQGVWASLTGGWFYDPHQDVFCNTFHLYIWLFLLCLPFTIYVYFPPTRFLWYVYCGSVAIVLTLIKLINYGLHHMYDTTECVQEKVEDDWQGTKKEDEGIELQILSKKSGETTRPPARSLPTSYTESAALQSTDADSIESNEFSQTDLTEIKPNTSRIDLKAEVHRKNSSESSDDVIPTIEIIPQASEPRKAKKSERRTKHQRSKTDGFVITGVAHPPVQPQSSNSFWKLCPQEATDFSLLRPALDCEAGTSGLIGTAGRRHSNFTNSSLNFLPTNVQPDIKPTGSLELAYIDKNPNQALTSEGFYFEAKPRRIRSTALETCCPPPSMTAHPNSLEIIGCKSTRNPLPPPSTSLRRNQHLNLCPYFGSEIVYPIAEQSDEHQTSHGPDTDLDSLTHISDSDFDEMSHSPLIYIKLKKVPARTHVPYGERKSKVVADEERTSATSKDALLENDNSNSSATPEMHDARADCYCTDAELSDKKLSECSCSNTSVECDERTEQFQRKSRGKRGASVDSGGGRMWQGRGGSVDSENFHCNEGNEAAAIVRKRNVRKNKKRKLSCDVNKNGEAENCSSLDELEWLFDDGLKHRKEPLKRETEWSSTTTVSLEHDVSKVLQETVPSSARSLGAIPKKNRSLSSQNDHQSDRKTPKSESDKCSMCRCKSDVAHSALADKSHHIKENQKLRHSNSTSPVEGATYVVARKLHRVNVPVKAAANRQAPSTSTNTELSTLLPPARDPLLAALLDMRCDVDITDPSVQACMKLEVPLHHRNRLKRCRVNRRRSNQLVKRDSAIASSISAGYGTHSAKSFSDTSDGAIHCFVDEQGNWMTYSFDEKGIGTVNSRVTTDEKAVATVAPKSELWDLLNSNDSICHTEGAAKTRIHPSQNCANMHAVQVARLRRSLPEHMRFIRRRLQRDQTGVPPNNPDDSLISIVRESETEENRNHRFKFIQASDNNNYTRTKSYYKFKVLPWTFFKVTLDRLKLLALLDRNLTVSETVVSIVLGVLVSVLGAFLLYLDFYKDFLAFILCFIIASCQYSLLKSVQPDAASPTHGFNRVIAYSRPIYFCLIGAIVVILHANLTPATIELDYNFQRYSDSQTLILLSRDFFIKFILFFPILFSLGLFPQINTFLMYLLEQIDMHLFGGNAMSSLLASFYCIFRSVLAVLVMDGLVYGALIEPKSSQHILFSLFSACLVASSYHLSRSASDPSHVWNILKRHLWPPDIYREHASNFEAKVDIESEEAKVKEKSVSFPPDVKEASEPPDEHVDPLPNKLRKTVNGRLQNDVILCSLIAILVFGIHASTVFTVLQPELSPVLWSIAASLGLILHYIIPQLRKQLPWLCIARPIFRSYEHEQYQIRGPAKIMWFERVYVYFCFLERSILYPLLFLSAMTEDAPKIAEKYGPLSGSFMVVICGLKCLRSSYSDQTSQYLILTFTALFIKYDYSFMEETFLVQYFFMSLAFHKFYELLLKVQFVVTYIAPWQITWGSAFHAFAQPFSVPHSAMLFLQAFISAALSTPLNPFLGSAIFLTSYVRPVKFWERDYNTRRVDHSNTPLSSHLDRNLGADDNNLNSIFYEHLTRSLQHSLCGDLAMGRWGPVNQGDCFVLASDYLNCLVHIIEMGNGLVTFQMRGLEFRGTYCQQREVEAITEGVEENDGCCCCNTGHLPNMLSVNAAFSQRWLAWEVTAAKYILEGYSISDNSAVSMLQVFEFRKVLVSYYVKSIIFYTIRSPKLDEWLASQSIQKALQPMAQRNFVDLDPVFNGNINEDFDVQFCGMTRNMFEQVYGDWISYCVERNEKSIDTGVHSNLVLLCFALSLLGRRTLGAVSHNVVSNVEFFLYGLHALFKGDFRITCARDEWVFSDMDLLKTVVAPGVRMSLKLHQDHFMSPDEYEDQPALYDAICKHEEELVISHEGDPAWRSAVLSGTASLLALRHVVDDGVDEYKIIMLNKRYLSFRVIKINKECVRGLWAGQQQELVYLRNRNPERGSIQNAKQALRNIINSSCDQPIGYPIYVSPLTTSYAETNEQYRGLVGGSVSLKKIRNYVFNLFRRIRKRCGEGCSSGASNREEIGMGHEGVYAMTPITTLTHQTTGSQSIDGSHLGGSIGRGSSLSRTSLGGNRGSLVSMGKPTSSTLASLAGLFKEKDERAVSQVPDAQTRADERLGDVNDTSTDKDCIYNSRIVRISDPNVVYDAINLGRRIDVIWPTEYMRIRGGRSNWKDWIPEVGMEGPVVHKWTPSNKDANKRSHVDRTILLVQIDERFVPIAESGVQDLGQDG